MYTQLKPIFSHPCYRNTNLVLPKESHNLQTSLTIEQEKGRASNLRLTQRASLKNATDTNKRTYHEPIKSMPIT